MPEPTWPNDEHPWCPHPDCHDRAHLDGTHTDEHGRPFNGDHSTDPAEWQDPELTPPFGTPVYDQLVAEQTYPELT